MTIQIPLADLELFQFFKGESCRSLASCFDHTVKLEPGETYIRIDSKVNDLSIILEGWVSVYAGDFSRHIMDLKQGASIGEMSLIEPDSTASASIKAGEEGALLQICSFPRIKEFLDAHDLHGAFYRGAAALLSRRLRNTDQLIHKNLKDVTGSIFELLQDQNVVTRLDTTKTSIDKMGGLMTREILGAVSTINSFIRAHPDLDAPELQAAADQLEQFSLEDLQYVDRIAQKLGLINQIIRNVERTIMGDPLEKIQGDQRIFDD